jgi:hypothetical protein
LRISFFVFLLFTTGLFSGLSAQKLTKHTVYFDVDQYTLTASEKTALEDFIRQEGNSTYISSIRITGHTDADASSAYNIKLSERRVKTVADLFRKDHPLAPITEEWLGEVKPVNNNTSDAEKKLNRRVEITIERWVPDYVEPVSTIKDLYTLLEQQKQRICIDPKGDTTIRLEQGTILYFPPEPFGKIGGKCVEIRAKEVYKKSDMILENLSTTSNGSLLESAGMVYLEAAVNNQLVQLASGKKVIILLPADTLRDDMKGFFGKRDPHTDIINWEASLTDPVSALNTKVGANCQEILKDRQPNTCERCKIFFCRFQRFDDFMKGTVNGSQRDANRSFRKCQRNLRRSRGAIQVTPSYRESDIANCQKLDSLFKQYGVKDYASLQLAMNKEKMDKYGVKTLEELRDTLNKIQIAGIEKNLKEGKLNEGDLQYYLLSTAQLGWINCDAFSKLKGDKITINTDLKVDEQTACKAVFLNVAGMLPGIAGPNNFQFSSVPKGHEIWLIGLRFLDKQAYLSMKRSTSQEKVEMGPFQKVSLEELKEALKKVD